MNHKNTWKKVLSTDEKIEFEFSISDRYIKFSLIVWVAVIGLLILFSPIMFSVSFLALYLSFLGILILVVGIIIFLIVLFYFGFYLKVANAYALTNKRVLIHRGWLSTNLVSIDYSKITDVSIYEPFFGKIITHSGYIAINTAGTQLQEVILKNIKTPYEIKKKLDLLKSKH